MEFYVYQSDLYCEDCGEAIRKEILADVPSLLHARFECESDYDSDEYPKGPYDDSMSESDCPQHCGAGEECVNAITVGGANAFGHSWKVGAFLENDLTDEGIAFVREAIAKNLADKQTSADSVAIAVWLPYYRQFHDDIEPKNDDEKDEE